MSIGEVLRRTRVHAPLWEPLESRRTAALYAAVGTASTAAYITLFAMLQTQLNAPTANLIALLTTTLANTAAQRRITFGIQGRARRLRAHAGGLAAMSLSLGMTTLALASLAAVDQRPPTLLAATVLWLTTALVSWMRFGPLRHWIGAAAMAPGRLGTGVARNLIQNGPAPAESVPSAILRHTRGCVPDRHRQGLGD